MDSIQRESSRVSSTKSSTMRSERQAAGRPSILSKAYNTVSYRGSRVGSRLGKVTSATSDSDVDASESVPATKSLKSFSGVFPVPEPGSTVVVAPELTPEQEEKYAQVFEYFKNQKDFPVSLQPDNSKREPASDWEKLRLLSKESMLRYLRATRWDVVAAKKRLTETIAWRREFGVDNLDPDEMAKEAKSGKETVLGYDNRSRPLHYMHPHRNDTKESPRQMQFAVWILERCIDLMPPGIEQLALLINFDHKSRNPTSIANAKLMLYILQNHYVERLGVALCINVPWVFKMFWNAIQPFIDPVTKSKCKFDEAIKDEVPAGQLSSEFGGDLDAKYNHDSYWPDLVKISAERRKDMLRRFKEECNSEIGASEWIIRGGDDTSSVFSKKGQTAASELTTTTESSGLRPSSDPQGGERAREVAVAASNQRIGEASSPTYEEPQTPLERYKTPTDTLNSNPLERHFSTTSSLGAGAVSVGAAATSLEAPAEKPVEEEEEEAVESTKSKGQQSQSVQNPSEEKNAKSSRKEQHRQSGSSGGWHHFEGEVSKGFKGLNHKIHDSFTHAFLPSGNSTRRNSREARRSGDGSMNKRASGIAKEEKELAEHAAEADRMENIETGDLSAKANGKLPSATEAATLAGTAGVSGATGAIGVGSTDANKVPGDAQRATITMLFFAAAKEAAGVGREQITLPQTPFPLSQLGQHLLETVSKSDKGNSKELEKVLQRSKWSVDEDMIDEEEMEKITLKGGEDVAIIPPVSGG